MDVSLVMTVIGPDRPGIVSALADCGRSFDANWAESRMASLAGQFAGIVRWQVAAKHAEAMATELRKLEASGLQIVIATSDAHGALVARRLIAVELVGHDRPGIVHDVARELTRYGASIEALDTEIASAAWSGEPLFKATATVAVPQSVALQTLRQRLEALANDLMVDVNVQEHPEHDPS